MENFERKIANIMFAIALDETLDLLNVAQSVTYLESGESLLNEEIENKTIDLLKRILENNGNYSDSVTRRMANSLATVWGLIAMTL